MNNRPDRARNGELVAAIKHYRSAFVTVAIVSAILNVLLLGGSFYMMLIYDSVLPSHSIPTLVGLLVMIVIVYLFQGLFDNIRVRTLAEVAAALDRQMTRRVQSVMSRSTLLMGRQMGDGLSPLRDLDNIRAFLASSGPPALIDLPWIVFFLGILFLLHYWLGVAALVGAIILLAITYATDRMTKAPTAELAQVATIRMGAAESNLRHSEVAAAMGMRAHLEDRWEHLNHRYLEAHSTLSSVVGVLGGASRIFRLFLQSIILTIGALLVIDGKATGGVIFASSILSARALAPVDQAIGNWRGFAAARLSWKRLDELLRRFPAESDVITILPSPVRTLQVQQLVVAPPGTQTVTLQGIDFILNAGESLGIVGPSAAGKSTLGRAILGIWKPLRGAVRLDGAALDQWDDMQLGRSLGYLPQSVELLDGTVAENIARFDPAAASEAVVAAARAAGVHDIIVNLPQGYDTPVGADGRMLSAGQQQRVGLARALYGDPFIVMLDEPNSNLDSEGENALDLAIASVSGRGGIVIVIAHRPSVLNNVSHVLLLQNGRMEAFGPKKDILSRLLPKQNRRTGGTNADPSANAIPGNS